MSIRDTDLGGFDADEARYNRMNRTSQPEFQPGMELDNNMDLFNNNTNDGSGDIFGQSTQPVNNGMAGDIFSQSPSPVGGNMGFGQPSMNNGSSFGVFNSSPFGQQPSSNGMMQQQPQAMSEEDKIFEAMAKGAKSSGDFITDLISSFGKVTPLYWTEYGRSTMIVGGVTSVSSLLMVLLGWHGSWNLLLAGLFSTMVGTGSLFFNMDKVKNLGISDKYKDGDGNVDTTQQIPQQQPMQQPMQDPFSMNSSNDFFNNTPVDDWGGSDDDDEDWDGIDDEDDDDFGLDLDEIEEEPVAPAMSADDALNSMVEISAGMYTRQYLWDTFIKVLPSMKPNYAKFETIDEDEDVFVYWDEKLQEAAGVTGMKEDDLECLELIELKENMFTVVLKTTRPKGFKPELVGDEIARIYSYNDETGEFKEGVFAQVDNVGANSIITIFTGASEMISLLDMMNNQKDYILDNKHLMPVIFGVNQRGNVIIADFKNLESILITGMPRSGKSWFATAVLTQMCAFMSPRDLHIYICDPKGGTSDYKDFCLPHVKKFVSGDENIVAAVRDVVRVESARRAQILGDANCKNIWDYREKFPDVEFPVIYVVIDEVVTLAERMEKEMKAEFQGYLIELITRLPSYGIRAILIPHVIKDQVIKKTATDTIPCRISVKGDAGHIETVTGAKPKDFPYKLSRHGDMAVRVPDIDDKVMYLKAPVLNATNDENAKLFDYMRRYWLKLEPDCDKGSVAVSADTTQANQKVLDNLGMNDFNLETDDDDLDFSDLFNQ